MTEAEVTTKIEPLTFFFRKLSVGDKRLWRKAARKKYEPFSPIDGTWHPVYQAECVAMNDELATYTMEPIEDPYCPKCGYMWSAHNDDGSCVED